MQQGQEYDPFGAGGPDDDEMRRFLAGQGNTGVAGPDPEQKAAASQATVAPWDRSAFRDEINGAADGYAVAQKYGIKLDKAGRGTLPDGAIMDLIEGAGAGGKKGQWIGVGDQHGMYSGVGGPGGAAGPAGPGAGGGTPADVTAAIKRLLDRGFTTPSEADPEIAAQLAPQYHAIDRGAQRTRQASAERAAQSGALVGGEGGGFDSAVTGIMEGAASQKAGAAGKVIGDEVAGRRQDVVNALQFAQGEEKMRLEKQLADMDAEIKRQGLSQQNQQFYDNYGWTISPDNPSNRDVSIDDIRRLLGA